MDLIILLPLLLLVGVMVLSSRQRKKAETKRQDIQSSLSVGDVVSTTSGLRGEIVDTSYEETIDLEIAPGVVTTWERAAILRKVDVPGEADEAADAPEAPAARVDGATAGSVDGSVTGSVDNKAATVDMAKGEPTSDPPSSPAASDSNGTPGGRS